MPSSIHHLEPLTNGKKELSKVQNIDHVISAILTDFPITPKQNRHSEKYQFGKSKSTPTKRRRKKTAAEKLLSNLSPNYIGFSTTLNGKRRSRSLQKSYSKLNRTPTTPNLIENEGILTNSLCYVRMTPTNIRRTNASLSSANEDSSPIDFESPIEKLIKKNKELSDQQLQAAKFNKNSIIHELNGFENSGAVNNNDTKIIKRRKRKVKKYDVPEKIEIKTERVEVMSPKRPKVGRPKKKHDLKLVNLISQDSLNNDSYGTDIESDIPLSEIKAKTKLKTKAAQVVLHKSPKVEKMHNESIKKKRKKNIKISHKVKMLSGFMDSHNIIIKSENQLDDLETTGTIKLDNIDFEMEIDKSLEINQSKRTSEIDSNHSQTDHNTSILSSIEDLENVDEPETIPNLIETQICCTTDELDQKESDKNGNIKCVSVPDKNHVKIGNINGIENNESAETIEPTIDDETVQNYFGETEKHNSHPQLNLFEANEVFDMYKFSETEIQNSELTLENGDVLTMTPVEFNGTVDDEDIEMMNISPLLFEMENNQQTDTAIINRIETPPTADLLIKNEEIGQVDITTPVNSEEEPKTDTISYTNLDENNVAKSIDKLETKDSLVSSFVPTSQLVNEEISIAQQNETIEKKIPEMQSTSENNTYAYTLMNNSRITKSPSSADSAKGSSIDIETNFQPKFGEIFWGKISTFPFWPCIVWPDPEGKTISVGKSGVRQHIQIHVRFFADNGRRSWIRKENLMAYNGREDFERKKREFWQRNQLGKKHLLARAFLINDSKKPIWNQAALEASLVFNEHIEKRSDKFEQILEEMRKTQFFEKRKRRESILHRRHSLLSTTGSDDIFNTSTSSYANSQKRDRSPTPESPAFEDVDDFKTFVKKRKINLAAASNKNDIQQSSDILQNTETSISVSPLSDQNCEEIDFNSFGDTMKLFISPNKDDETRFQQILRELWELKLHSNLGKTSINYQVNGDNISQRTSKRIKTLVFRRSLPEMPPPSSSMIHGKDKPDKRKREKSKKPIEELVADILELNKNYLFKDLKREPVCKVCLKPNELYKCSGKCQSWLHESCADLPAAQFLPTTTIKEKKNVTSNPTVIEINTVHVTGDGTEIFNQKIDKDGKIIVDTDVLTNISTPNMETICKECKDKSEPICFVCKQIEKQMENRTNELAIKCNINSCGKYFHQICLKYWPQARISKSKDKIEKFICPSHTCQTCVSDDPKGKFIQLKNCTKCVLCPASYHVNSTCIPAGSKLLTATEMICPRHRQNKLILNTNWCFICADGGNLICCESCPTSFHIECLNIAKLPDGGYICEECETGRMPLYGELIWAKLGTHKWWPCITIPPPQIPNNLHRVKHNDFDFCVRFFGTYDHSWISRDRVFLYQEDDWRYSSKLKTTNKDFRKALEEANSISELLKGSKLLQKDDEKKVFLPTPYKKIYVNRPVPPIKIQEVDLSNDLNPCNCNPTSETCCDMFSGCLNRILMIECHPKICPAGINCNNQMFEKRIYAPVKVARTNGRGFGLVSEAEIPAGTFIIEYVGELIDDTELKRRVAQKLEEKDENYYFLTIQPGLVIDAGPKGNVARFMNHSCEPNCETQKWNVNGNTRIGLFAINNIAVDTELTFNYNLESIGDDRKPCFCGAKRCAGFIGAKYKKPEKKEPIPLENNKVEKIKLKTRKRKSSMAVATMNAPLNESSSNVVPKNS